MVSDSRPELFDGLRAGLHVVNNSLLLRDKGILWIFGIHSILHFRRVRFGTDDQLTRARGKPAKRLCFAAISSDSDPFFGWSVVIDQHRLVLDSAFVSRNSFVKRRVDERKSSS